jgi:hypothetical protein
MTRTTGFPAVAWQHLNKHDLPGRWSKTHRTHGPLAYRTLCGLEIPVDAISTDDRGDGECRRCASLANPRAPSER